MKVKICGLTNYEQIEWCNNHGVDMVGLNFYELSKRYVSKPIPKLDLVKNTVKTGIFVNSSLDNIKAKVKAYHLGAIQLHGHEPAGFCKDVSALAPVLKVFGVDDNFDFAIMAPYLPYVSYFLFDTRSAAYGGSGKKFNWQLLHEYPYELPFFLSGGIRLEDVNEIMLLNFRNLAGIDVNSGFELSPGNKDLTKIGEMLKLINNEKS